MTGTTDAGLDMSSNIHITVYNANRLNSREVALSFVPIDAYTRLQNEGNTLLAGPRGSGKTTLLKMMLSEALEYWSHDEAVNTRSRVRASGIFVPADRIWNTQLTAWSADVDEKVAEAISYSAFAAHIGRALTTTMRHRVYGPELPGLVEKHLRARLSAESEVTLSDALADAFALEQRPLTLERTYRLFQRRLQELGILRRRVNREDVAQTLPHWIDVDPLSAVSLAVEAFNDLAGEAGRRWNLMFDELELAPGGLVEELLGRLRSTDPLISYKLSISPADHALRVLNTRQSAVQGQDFDYVPLTVSRRIKSVLDFSKAVFERELKSSATTVPISMHRLLGGSQLKNTDIEDSDRDNKTPQAPPRGPGSDPYHPGGSLWRRYESLSAKDESFRNYLKRNRIELSRLGELSSSDRDSKLRKMRNVVVVRDHYRSVDGRRRSRKSFEIYTGFESMLALPDGNPRLMMTMRKEILTLIEAESGNWGRRMPTSEQNIAIARTLESYLPLLRAQPPVQHLDGLVSLIDLLDVIGVSLSKRIVEQDFNPDVAIGFNVDRNVASPIVELLERGVDSGALVHLDSGTPGHAATRLYGEVREQRFRLSHILAPQYGLPLTLGRSVQLSGLLPRRWTVSGNRDGNRAKKSQPGQGELFRGGSA
jgi:hypothetical protein